MHYASYFQDTVIINIMDSHVDTEESAIALAKFIWRMADQMAIDSNNQNVVLGGVDNSDMLPDVVYELTLYLDRCGYSATWDAVSSEA